jgi:ParB-like chromosome segregation protein Spo0J
MSGFRVEHLSIAGLKPNPRNARRHSQKQLNQITASIREFGFNSIVVVDEDGFILVGHGRVEGARIAGLQTVPVLRVDHLTAEQKIAFSLADIKIALNSDWQMNQLTLLWRELAGAEINFDLEVTGFETAEIDLLVDGHTDPEKVDRSDLIPPMPMPAMAPHMPSCSAKSKCGWSLRTRPTMFPWTVMWLDWVRSSTASSRWPPAK